jgi:Tfp pilus assembly protein FimT
MVSMSKKNIHRNRAAAGISLMELLLIVALVLTLTAMAIPTARSAIASYQLDAAVDSASGAIQGTRYQAIMHGYLYQVDINSTTNQYQVLSEVPPAVVFSAVGNAVPISTTQIAVGVGTANPGLTGHLIMQFKPNGSISVTSGQAMPVSFTIAYNGTTKTLTVSNYGSVSIQ